MTLSEVVLGGCSSYETSECQSSILENALGSGRREPSLYTTVNADRQLPRTYYRERTVTYRALPQGRAPWARASWRACAGAPNAGRGRAARGCSVPGPGRLATNASVRSHTTPTAGGGWTYRRRPAQQSTGTCQATSVSQAPARRPYAAMRHGVRTARPSARP